MVKDPFKKWDRVDTFCALLFDLGTHVKLLCITQWPTDVVNLTNG